MVRLVAEQACELTGAACCVVTIHAAAGRSVFTVAAYARDEVEQAGALEAHGLSKTHELIRAAGGAARLTGEEVEGTPAFASLPRSDRPPGGWLGARLTALDGSELGFVQLLGEPASPFTQLDADLVLQLAEMTSAALERATHYAR